MLGNFILEELVFWDIACLSTTLCWKSVKVRLMCWDNWAEMVPDMALGQGKWRGLRHSNWHGLMLCDWEQGKWCGQRHGHWHGLTLCDWEQVKWRGQRHSCREQRICYQLRCGQGKWCGLRLCHWVYCRGEFGCWVTHWGTPRVFNPCSSWHSHAISSFHQHRWGPARCEGMYSFFCVNYLLIHTGFGQWFNTLNRGSMVALMRGRGIHLCMWLQNINVVNETMWNALELRLW